MENGIWKVEPASSSVEVSIKHLGVATVRGVFADLDGTLEVAEDGSLAVEASIGTASLSTEDPRRDGFLTSPDFLDCERHPRATFRAVGSSTGGKPWTLAGTLTLAGTTAPLELRIEPSSSPGSSRVTVRAEVDRHAHDLRFPQGAGAGDAVVGKKARIQAGVSLTRA